MDNSNLDKLLISYPCPIKWDNIKPEEKEWLCSQCDKKVVNLSTFTKTDTEQFLANKLETGELCVRVRIGADGKVISDNCPEFLKPVRNQYRLLEKTVAAGLLLLVTWIGFAWEFCAYAADPKSGAKGNDPISKSIKNAQTCLKYKLKGEEGNFFTAGQPAYNEIRESIELLIFGKNDDRMVKDFQNEIERTKTVDLAKLEKLCIYLKNKDDYLGYFQCKILQYLIYTKSPNGEKPPVNKFELGLIREQAIKFHLNKAELYFKNGMKREVESELRLVRIAATQSNELAKNITLPKEVKIWDAGGHSPREEFDLTNWVISRADLQRIIVMDRRLNRKLYKFPGGQSVIPGEELEQMIKLNESNKTRK